MGSKLFPEFLTKSSKSHAEVTKSNKRLVGLACIRRSCIAKRIALYYNKKRDFMYCRNFG